MVIHKSILENDTLAGAVTEKDLKILGCNHAYLKEGEKKIHLEIK